MYLRYESWLAEQAAARRGGAGAKLLPITRGEPWSDVILLTPIDGNDVNLAVGNMTMSLGTSPSDGLGETNDVTVGTVTLDDGVYSIPVSLNAAQTGGLPADDDGDEVMYLYWQVRHNSGPGLVTLLAGIVPVLGAVARD